MKIRIENVRLSFPDLFVPQSFKPGDPPKFKATFLIPKNSPQLKKLEDVVLATAKEKWGVKAESILAGIRGNPNKYCVQDGDSKEYEGYQGMMAVTAKNDIRPTLLTAKKAPVAQADGILYAGCYVNAHIDLFTYDNTGKGISATLRGVQFYAHGDAFTGAGVADEDEFDSLEAPAGGNDDLV